MFTIRNFNACMILVCIGYSLAFTQSINKIISGIVVDDSTKLPVEMVQVVLSTGLIDPNSQTVSTVALRTDTVFTGADGSFTRQVTVDQNAYGLTYRLAKDGYQLKSGYSLFSSSVSVDLGLIAIKQIPGKRVTVTGTVIDTATGLPVELALVSLRTANISVSVDTVYTDKDGNFKKEIIVTGSQITPILFYSVSKKLYQTKAGQQQITGQVVDLGKIFITPGTNKKITVTGSVFEEKAEVPVQNALVLLTTSLGAFRPDSAYSGKDGSFKAEVEISDIGTIEPTLYYVVIKDGYKRATGKKLIVGTVVDLGQIFITPEGTAIIDQPVTVVPNTQKPATMTVYSLNGQILYSGAVDHFNPSRMHSCRSVIIHYKSDEKTLKCIKKYALTK